MQLARDDDDEPGSRAGIAPTPTASSPLPSPTTIDEHGVSTGERLVAATATPDLVDLAPTRATVADEATTAEVVADEAVVQVGAGELVLVEADLTLDVDADGQLTPGTAGVATLHLPTEGPLAGAMLDRPLRGLVGVAFGRDLAHLGAHLRDDERYLYADLGSQPFELFLDLDDSQPGTEALPEVISTVGAPDGAAMFVAGLDGDYFYLSTPCAAMVPTEPGASRRPAQQRDSDLRDADASQIPGVSADLSAFDPGGCGLGWSIGGFVPFTSWMTERSVDIPDGFGAHVVVDGTVPVHPGLSLDGELFYRFDSDGASVWANGELDVGLSFLEGAAEVSLPAIRGTFGFDLTPVTLDLWVTAVSGTAAADGSPTELLADIAPIRGGVDIDGELHIAGGEVLATSFLQLAGDVNIAPTPIRTSADVEVDDVVAADALVRIDRAGVMARGSLSVSPLGALSIDGSAELEFLVPFADPTDTYLQVRGALGVGDTALGGHAELRIDRTGAFARGSIDLAGMGALDVEGRLGPDGFQLTGAAEAVLPIGDLDRVAASLVDQTANDEVISVLDAQIEERVAQIAAGDAAKGSELRNTIADMRQAFVDIASVRETIAYNDAIIAQRWRDHQADIDWHWALNDFDRFWDKGPHAIRLAAILSEIEALKLANTVQYGYIDVAHAVVSATQQTVLAIIGWDEQLNALLALQTEAYVSTLTGNFVSTVLNGADAVLDAFGIDGSAVGTVTFTVGTQGVGATADLQWCRDGSCETVVGATVTLIPHVEVCATIVGLPACVRL